MASIGNKTVKQVATGRLANIKATGGLPAKPQEPLLSQSAKNIKVRQQAEQVPEAEIKRGKLF
jgi:hypothetical protein